MQQHAILSNDQHASQGHASCSCILRHGMEGPSCSAGPGPTHSPVHQRLVAGRVPPSHIEHEVCDGACRTTIQLLKLRVLLQQQALNTMQAPCMMNGTRSPPTIVTLLSATALLGWKSAARVRIRIRQYYRLYHSSVVGPASTQKLKSMMNHAGLTHDDQQDWHKQCATPAAQLLHFSSWKACMLLYPVQ